MWPNTKLTKILKIKLPIIQAPMAGGPTTPELIASVSNAGGLGSLGAGFMKPEDIQKAVHKIRDLTDQPFAVNLFITKKPHVSENEIKNMRKIINKLTKNITKSSLIAKPPYYQLYSEQLAVIIEEQIPVFSFTFGIPSDHWLKRLKDKKIKMIGTATTVSESILLEKKGIDLIAAQGYEAGGHRGAFLKENEESLVGTMALIPQMVDHVKIPVIASGGIMDGRGIVAAMILGASGVQMGTAFLACPESGTPSYYKKIILSSSENNTVLTRIFTGKFARAINTRFIEELSAYQEQILDYPLQLALIKQVRDIAQKKNINDYSSFWSGQAASLSRNWSAKKLIVSLDKQVKKIIKNFG